MRSDQRHRGYVLLLVLAVLVLAATTLASAARRRFDEALSAVLRTEQMQVRWGALSCQTFAVAHAERLLRQRKAQTGSTAASIQIHLRLNGMDFAIRIDDEQAKANVNLLARQHGNVGLAESLALLQHGQRRPLLPRLQPAPPAEGVITRLPSPYRSHAQLFVFKEPGELVSFSAGQDGPAARFTCWGGGQLNIARAELPVVRQVLAEVLDESHLDRLRAFREKTPSFTLNELIAHLELTTEQAERLRALAVVESRCHGAWVKATTSSRSYYRFAVRQAADAENDEMTWQFAW